MAELPAADGAALIHDERLRQVLAEGWTGEHDDEHGAGELLNAAACYVWAGQFAYFYGQAPGGSPIDTWHPWPWADDAWKPTGDPIRDLTKAGALIAAEIDRLQRKAARG